MQILRNVRGALSARTRIKATAPSFLGARIDAYLWHAAQDLPGTLAKLMRLIKLFLALKCLKWAKLLSATVRAANVARNEKRRKKALHADATIVGNKRNSVANLVKRARRRFSVV